MATASIWSFGSALTSFFAAPRARVVVRHVICICALPETVFEEPWETTYEYSAAGMPGRLGGEQARGWMHLHDPHFPASFLASRVLVLKMTGLAGQFDSIAGMRGR
jgi:hypothetical protein